jgi:hypothetical protein
MDLGMPIESVNERKLRGMPDRLAKMGGISWSQFFKLCRFPKIFAEFKLHATETGCRCFWIMVFLSRLLYTNQNLWELMKSVDKSQALSHGHIAILGHALLVTYNNVYICN